MLDANYRSRLKLFVVRVSVPNTDWLHLYTQMYTIVIGITIFITPFPIISPPIESNILSQLSWIQIFTLPIELPFITITPRNHLNHTFYHLTFFN